MAHSAPGVLGVSSEVGGAILAHDEARSLTGELHIEDAAGVDSGFDVVCIALFVQGNTEVIGAEGKHVLVKHEVAEGVGEPLLFTIAAIFVEDLGVEMSSGVNATRDIEASSVCVSWQAKTSASPATRRYLELAGYTHAMLL